MDFEEFRAKHFELFSDVEVKQSIKGKLNLTDEDLKLFCRAPAVTSVRLLPAPHHPYPTAEDLQVLHAQFATKLKNSGFRATPFKHSQFNLPDCVVITREETMRPSSDQMQALSIDIFVDSACGEAVLRGSDVFAPGILASSAPYDLGQECRICAMISKVLPLKGAVIGRNAEDQLTAGSGNTFNPKAHSVIVGKGVVQMSRQAVTSGVRGVAVKLIDSVHPSQSLLDEAAGPAIIVFLQNWSSMLPVSFLELNESVRLVVDMCAAPGGKSSHILSTIKHLYLGKGCAVPDDFRLVSCERSAARVAALKRLLVVHHGEAFVAKHVEIFRGDANKLSKPLESVDQKDPQSLRLLRQCHRVLLDPSCTGLGLRPRLRAHECTLADIRETADYQRKLMSTATSLAASGGIMTYSTCTIAPEENFENVQFARTTLPIAPNSDINNDVAQVMPAGEMDSVGFFVAKFLVL